MRRYCHIPVLLILGGADTWKMDTYYSLVRAASTTSLLVVNGTNDAYVPPGDVTLFEDHPNTVTRLVEGASHCAAEKSREVNPWAFEWITKQLATAD